MIHLNLAFADYNTSFTQFRITGI